MFHMSASEPIPTARLARYRSSAARACTTDTVSSAATPAHHVANLVIITRAASSVSGIATCPVPQWRTRRCDKNAHGTIPVRAFVLPAVLWSAPARILLATTAASSSSAKLVARLRTTLTIDQVVDGT